MVQYNNIPSNLGGPPRRGRVNIKTWWPTLLNKSGIKLLMNLASADECNIGYNFEIWNEKYGISDVNFEI